MKKIFFYAAALMVSLAACNTEEIVETQHEDGITILTANIAEGESRVHVGALSNNEYPITWSASTNSEVHNGDFLTVFGTRKGSKEIEAVTFYYLGKDNQTSGKFGIFEGEGLNTIQYALANVDAYDPKEPFDFNEGGNVDGSEKVKPQGERFPMYGAYKNGNLSFYQVVGLLKLDLTGEFEPGDMLTVTCEDGHKISGKAAISVQSSAPEKAKLIINGEGMNQASFPIKVSDNKKTGSVYAALPLGIYKFLEFKITRYKHVGEIVQRFETEPVRVTANGNITIDKNIYSKGLIFSTDYSGPAPLKATLGQIQKDGGSGSLQFTWKNVDQINVFKSLETADNQIVFYSNIDKDASPTSAEFYSTDLYDNANLVYSVHPKGRIEKGEEGKLSVSAFSEYTMDNVLNDFLMFGNYDKAKKEMKYEPTMGLLEINLPANWWKKEGYRIAIVNVQVEANRAIAGNGYQKSAKMNVRNNIATVEIPTSGSKTILLNRNKYTETTVYCPVPVGTDYETITIKLKMRVQQKEGDALEDKTETLKTYTVPSGKIEKKLYTIDCTK